MKCLKEGCDRDDCTLKAKTAEGIVVRCPVHGNVVFRTNELSDEQKREHGIVEE